MTDIMPSDEPVVTALAPVISDDVPTIETEPESMVLYCYIPIPTARLSELQTEFEKVIAKFRFDNQIGEYSVK